MEQTPTSFKGLVNAFINIIDLLVPVLFAVTFVIIMIKVIDGWVLNPADTTKRQAAKSTAIVGVAVMIVMLSVWGIVSVLQASILG